MFRQILEQRAVQRSCSYKRLWLVLVWGALLVLPGCGGADDPELSNAGEPIDASADGSSSTHNPKLSEQRQWIVGTVLDSINAQAIEGAVVTLDDMTAKTDSDGMFGFATFAGQESRGLSVRAEGFLPMDRLVPAGGYAQRRLPPVMLLPVDGQMELDGSSGGTLHVASAGIDVEAPPGAWQGTVTLRAGRIPLTDPLRRDLLLPAAIPTPERGLVAPIFAIVMDADGQQPSEPITVTVHVDAELPASVHVPVGRFDVETGQWVDVGTAEVVSGGGLRFTTKHFSTFAAALPALPADETAAPDLTTLSRAITPFSKGEPRLDPRSGAVQLGVPMPRIWRRGEPMSISFFYDSRTLDPSVVVPIAASNGKPGDSLLGRVSYPGGTRSVQLKIGEPAAIHPGVGAVAPGAVVSFGKSKWPGQLADAGADSGAYSSVLTTGGSFGSVQTGAYTVGVKLSSVGDAVLAVPTSDSFTGKKGAISTDGDAGIGKNSDALKALHGEDGKKVPAPEPVEHRAYERVAVAVDNRGNSPFGRGWNLDGLTRLVQPWCHPERVALAGTREMPALTFGEEREPVLSAMAPAFEAAGLDDWKLRGSIVAQVNGKFYVAFPNLREVWTAPHNGELPTRFAGGGAGTASLGDGKALDLNFSDIQAIAPGPKNDGLLVVTSSYITRISADGSAKRVVGTGQKDCTGDVIHQDEDALQSTFCRTLAPAIASDPSSERLVFGTMGGKLYEVTAGHLRALRVKAGTPHWVLVAFDPKGQLYYSAEGHSCVYKYVDGLTDTEIFPSCRDQTKTVSVDGKADEAVAIVGPFTTDAHGDLWFFDYSSGALRRYSPTDDTVVTVTSPKASDGIGATSARAYLSEASLGYIDSIAIVDESNMMLGGASHEDLVTTTHLGAETLVPMGSGDGSVLQHLPDQKQWVRVLENGIVERYDERGLLQSRGAPGQVPLEFKYLGDWQIPQDQEVCGRPLVPPLLATIELGGEVLWRFDYDSSVSPPQLKAVTDSSGRTLHRVHQKGRDVYTLPGNVRVELDYDDEGRIIEKTSPGPGTVLDHWKYSWKDGKLASYADPEHHVHEVTPAEPSAEIPEKLFNQAGEARDVDAKPVIGQIASQLSKKPTTVSLAINGVVIESPSGDETTLQNDKFGRLLRIEHPDGTAMKVSRDEVGRITDLINEQTGDHWRFRYGHVGDKHSGNTYLDQRLLERTDPYNKKTVFAYDGAGYLSERTDPAGTTRFMTMSDGITKGLVKSVLGPAGRRIDLFYDQYGNRERISVKEAANPSVEMLTTVTRNQEGQPTLVVEPTGRQLRYQYGPWGEVIGYTVGALADGHKLTISRASTGAWVQGGSTVGLAPILSIKDGEGHQWTTSYSHGWKQQQTSAPSAGTIRFAYDSEGRMTTRTLQDGSREELSYDGAGKIASRRWIGGNAGASIEFQYDSLGRVQVQSDLLVKEERTFETGFGWTEMKLSATSVGPKDYDITLTRKRQSYALTKFIQDAHEFWVTRGFDRRVENVVYRTGGSSRDLVKFERDGARHLTKVVRANGTSTTITYDGLGRPVHQVEQTASGKEELDITWDGDRPITRVLDGVSRSYGWDDAGRLISCSDTGENFAYDRSDARTKVRGHQVTRDVHGRMTQDGTYRYEYDELGRRTLKVSLSDASDRTVYRYGPGGWLQSVLHGPSGSETELASYKYDGAGRRITRTTAAGTWTTAYLPDTDRPFYVREPDGTVWHLVHATGAAAWTAAISSDGRERYVHLDPFQRVIGISNETGVFTPIRHECYGKRISSQDPGGPSIGFHGMVYDAETGLYLSGARYYDPEAGEFLSPEPQGAAAAPSIYGYTFGNPILQQDPNGRFIFTLMAGAAVGASIFASLAAFANSDTVRDARRSYQKMADVATDDNALGESEKAHERLHRAAKRGGRVAVKSVVKAGQAVVDPATDAEGAADAMKEAAESILSDSEGEDDD